MKSKNFVPNFLLSLVATSLYFSTGTMSFQSAPNNLQRRIHNSNAISKLIGCFPECWTVLDVSDYLIFRIKKIEIIQNYDPIFSLEIDRNGASFQSGVLFGESLNVTSMGLGLNLTDGRIIAIGNRSRIDTLGNVTNVGDFD